MSRSVVVSMALALGWVAVGCSGKADSSPTGEPPRRVQVVKAEKRRIPRTVVAVGTLAAEDRAELGFKVPGRLARWDVDLGSKVADAAVLAELDARDYELRRDRARAALEQRGPASDSRSGRTTTRSTRSRSASCARPRRAWSRPRSA